MAKSTGRAVYKLKHAGKTYYRVGNSAQGVRARLARELSVKPENIEILDEGRKQ